MEKQIRLGTHISKDVYLLLRDLTEEYGTQSKAIEVAIKFLHEIHRRHLDIKTIITRETLIENFDCVIITRSNLNNFIRREIEKFYSEDFIEAMVRFLLNVDLGEASIDEIVKVLDKIYVKAAKWFSSIILDKKKDCYELIFTHTSDLNFSKFFIKYFKIFIQNLGYSIEGEKVSSKFFSIIFKKLGAI